MKNTINIIAALVLLALAGCASVADLESQVVLGNVAEVKAKIKEAVTARSISSQPQIIEDSDAQLHYRWNRDLIGARGQVDLVYYFAPAERGTRVSLIEALTTQQTDADGKLVSRTTSSEQTSEGPGLYEMRGWFFERAK